MQQWFWCMAMSLDTKSIPMRMSLIPTAWTSRAKAERAKAESGEGESGEGEGGEGAFAEGAGNKGGEIAQGGQGQMAGWQMDLSIRMAPSA